MHEKPSVLFIHAEGRIPIAVSRAMRHPPPRLRGVPATAAAPERVANLLGGHSRVVHREGCAHLVEVPVRLIGSHVLGAHGPGPAGRSRAPALRSCRGPRWWYGR